MRQEKFNAETLATVKQLKIKNEVIHAVTLKTEPGIYTFKNVPNVAIFNLRRVVTGTKSPKVEVLFDFCLRSFELKLNGNYYADAYSRHLRNLTKTNPKNKECEEAHKSGPVAAKDRDKRNVWADAETVKANETPAKKSKKSK